jgi:hypothetical protein
MVSVKKKRKRVMLKLEKESNSRNVSVIKDALGHNVVMINDIIFRGKRGIYTYSKRC